MPQLSAAGHSLAYQWIEGTGPVLVFLHEGLGSIAQWRDFPANVARATGCRALVYDRYGYGNSDILLERRVGVDFMHREALLFLPEILKALKIENPILVGHSDGASIALIHAGDHPVRGVAVMAPHVFIEDVCVNSIRKAAEQFETGELPQRLGKYHRDARKTFHLWADAWLDPAFRQWNIEETLQRIKCPLLAIQGEDDEYGTLAQLDAIARQAGGPCELLKLPACGHSPHKDQPVRVLQALTDFVARTQ
jgi:pimeloyl-ACP methyl ester carboxylesterase